MSSKTAAFWCAAMREWWFNVSDVLDEVSRSHLCGVCQFLEAAYYAGVCRLWGHSHAITTWTTGLVGPATRATCQTVIPGEWGDVAGWPRSVSGQLWTHVTQEPAQAVVAQQSQFKACSTSTGSEYKGTRWALNVQTTRVASVVSIMCVDSPFILLCYFFVMWV